MKELIKRIKKEKMDGKYHKIMVKIECADDCNNGHSDFSITASLWYKDDNGNIPTCGGCCHEEILDIFPEYQIFVDLHLCNYLGIPMYGGSNAIYHIKQGNRAAALKLLRCTEDQLDELTEFIEDENTFNFKLHELGLVKQWKAQADKAIAMLLPEGETFEPVTRRVETVECDSVEAKKKIASGYFTEEERILRREALRKEMFEAKEKKILTEYERQYNILKTEKDLDLLVLGVTPVDNHIIYSHYDPTRLVLNWKDYDDQISPAEIDLIVDKVNKSNLNVKVITGGNND